MISGLRYILSATLVVVPLSVVVFVAYFIYAIATKPAPHFFPLDDPSGIYTIVKSSFTGNNPPEIIRANDSHYLYYYVEYKGERIYLVDGLTSFAVLVGQSNAELGDFAGKSVQIKGDFVRSRRQCIVTKCNEFTDSRIVLNIDEIMLR